MYESKFNRNKRLFEKRANMFGVKEGHTIFCDEYCDYSHHEILLSLVQCKRTDTKTFENFKSCVLKMLSTGWNRNSDIPDDAKYFQFPLVHWAAVYGKLYALQWLLEQDFDVEVTNVQGETALHRLVSCQAHERAVDPRVGRGRRYSLANIIQIFTKVLNILTGKCPQMLLRYDYVERNTPLGLCLKLLLENLATCQRLVQYQQALFKVLCDRLVQLLKQEKLSKEFVKNGLTHKDSSGNTIWHVAARFRSETVTSSLNAVLSTVEGLNLSIANSNYETPIMVALKNSNKELASFLEEYKFSNSSTVPIVKMEMLSDSERDECCCEHLTNAPCQSMEQGMLQDDVDRCDGLCNGSSNNETSVGKDASLIRDDQSFTDQPRNALSVEQEKVVLTSPADENDELQPNTTGICDSKMEVYPVSQGSTYCETDLMGDESCGQESLVIEKQIDLCLSVSQSTEGSDLTTTDESTSRDLPTELEESQLLESSSVQGNSCGSSILAEALRQADVNDNDVFLARFHPESMRQHTRLPTPPDSSTSPELPYQSKTEPQTPPSKEINACRGESVTPVLLIKLLSEPDVSEKFQSLLKDVITGDTAKVDSTQTALEQLKASRLRLDCEISSSEEVLTTISTKKEKLNQEIKRLQQETSELQATEEMSKRRLMQLKNEQLGVIGKIEECESTCSRLKRRLSDCTGALVGLSPKSQKRC